MRSGTDGLSERDLRLLAKAVAIADVDVARLDAGEVVREAVDEADQAEAKGAWALLSLERDAAVQEFWAEIRDRVGRERSGLDDGGE